MKKFCVLLTLLSCLLGLSFSLPLIATDSDEDIAFTIASATGVLDTVNTTTATGWACDPSQPSQPLRVIFFVDGVIFAGSTIANLQREEAVAERCGGNGQHGFIFKFPAGIVRILSGTTKTHTVSAFVIPFPFGFPVQLQNSPQTVPTGSSPSRTPTPNASASSTPSIAPSVTPSTTPSPNAGAVNGFLDFANTTAAGGWACNPSFPNTPLTVYVLIDNLFFGGTTLASENRTDVTGVCGGSPLHGWTIIFVPDIVTILENTSAHNVSAFAVPVPPGPPFELHNSPRVVQTSATVMMERLNRLRPPTKPRGKAGKV